MRRSLLLRLLALSLAVAALSIGATAWLTTRGAGERLEAGFADLLDAHDYVTHELLYYAQWHDSWADVGTLLGYLSDTTGQQIALTTLGGDVLANSADSPDLPASLVGRIDAVAEPPPVDTYLATTSFSLADLDHRKWLADRASKCVSANSPVPVEVWATGDVIDHSGRVTPEVIDACVSPELRDPKETSSELLGQVADLATACVNRRVTPSAAVAPTAIRRDSVGLVVDLPAVSGAIAPKVEACWAEAEVEVLEPYVAPPALLYLGASDQFDPFADGNWQPTAVAGLGVLAAAAGLTFLAGRRLTRPIRALTVAAGKMGAGDRETRVPVSGPDEVGRLGQAFNAMADSIERGERQRRAMATDVAHELRTPLANLRGYLEAAEDGVVALDAGLVTSLLEESAQLQGLIDDLQDLALADADQLPMHQEDVDAADFVRQVVAAHQASADTAGLRLAADAPEPVTIHVDPMRMRQALGNLVANAVRYTPAGGEVTVRVRRSAEGSVLITVEDNGPGIAATHLPHLFDRFYRAERSRSRVTGGSGLGLAIASQMVAANGGTVEVSSTPNVGSVFTIRLPAHSR